MAERLTRNNKVNFYFHDEASNMVYYKLQALEDIMEKYNIESLDTLEHIIKKGKVIFAIADNVSNIAHEELEADRDIWKKACELACKEIDCEYMYGINKENCSQYFYQQAKKEGENK